MPLHIQNSPPISCHHTLGRRKLLIPLGSIFPKICFPRQQKEAEETMICFIKIQSENMKMAWEIRLFIFCMICNFFKCDGFTVLYLLYSMVLILLPLLFNHNNLILNLHWKKNSYLDEEWLFTGRIKVRTCII